jgi:protein-disulfide isomerase
MQFLMRLATYQTPAFFRMGRCARLVAYAATIFLSASLTSATLGAVGAAESPVANKTEIEKIVHDYIITNPEVIRDAIEELDRRQKIAEAESAKRAVAKSGDKLFNSKFQEVVGNPAGDVTLVEFFDYNCGYCRQSVGNIAKLIGSDPNLRVVLKDLPILGPQSTEAAQVAMAVREQLKGEKFFEFHRKLLSMRGGVGKTQALNVARESGVDMDRLEKDLKSPQIHAGLAEVAALADDLHFTGTPSWVIGNETILGAVSSAQLKAKIDNVRKCGKTVC